MCIRDSCISDPMYEIGIRKSTTPRESWIFGFQFRTSDQKYKELDPASQIIPHHKQDLISLQSKYSFTKTMIGDLTLNQTKKASNDASKAYQESQLALQLIMVYWCFQHFWLQSFLMICTKILSVLRIQIANFYRKRVRDKN